MLWGALIGIGAGLGFPLAVAVGVIVLAALGLALAAIIKKHAKQQVPEELKSIDIESLKDTATKISHHHQLGLFTMKSEDKIEDPEGCEKALIASENKAIQINRP